MHFWGKQQTNSREPSCSLLPSELDKPYWLFTPKRYWYHFHLSRLASHEPLGDGDRLSGVITPPGVSLLVEQSGVECLPLEEVAGLIRFSFCLLLQNQTLTTSRSICRLYETLAISSELGLGFRWNAFSSEPRIFVSILVRFFLRLPTGSIVCGTGLLYTIVPPFRLVFSASSSHLCRSGFSLHIFLKLRFRASNREMVVWLKSFPYSFPMARPTSPWVKPEVKLNHNYGNIRSTLYWYWEMFNNLFFSICNHHLFPSSSMVKTKPNNEECSVHR